MLTTLPIRYPRQLLRSKTGIAPTDALINRMVRLVVETGSLTGEYFWIKCAKRGCRHVDCSELVHPCSYRREYPSGEYPFASAGRGKTDELTDALPERSYTKRLFTRRPR